MSRSITPRAARGPRLRALRGALVTAAMALAGAAAGFVAAVGADSLGLLPEVALSDGEWLAIALLAAPAWLLVVLAHEAGHLLGGAAAGFRPQLLVAGPLKLSWAGGRARVGLNRSLGYAGGLAAATPRDSRNLRRGMLLMVLGGPLGSLAVGAAALAGAQLAGGLANALLLLLAAIGLMITLVTLAPLEAGGFSSDGARVLMLLRGGPEAERWCAMAVLAGAATAGRLAEAEPDLVARATALRDGSSDAVGAAFLAYGYHLARGEVGRAGAELDQAMAGLETLAPATRPMLLAEAAYFSARHRGDAAAARALLEQTRGSPAVEAYTRRRAEAAVLRAEGRPDEARAAAEAGLEALARARIGELGALDAALLSELR